MCRLVQVRMHRCVREAVSSREKSITSIDDLVK